MEKKIRRFLALPLLLSLFGCGAGELSVSIGENSAESSQPSASESVSEKASESQKEVESSSQADEVLEKLIEDVDFYYETVKDDNKTVADYDLPSTLKIDGTNYDVTWALEVKNGLADNVKLASEKDEQGYYKVTVIFNEDSSEQTDYTLTATISVATGQSTQITLSKFIPQFKELSWDEFVATADDEDVVVKGVVTALSSKSRGNTYNTLYVQDPENKGAYYAYAMADDPVDLGIEVGMTVRVSGTRDTYSGTYEIANGTGVAKILSTEKVTVEPTDYTEIFTNATSLKDDSLVAAQGLYVTIKDVTVGTIGSNSSYYMFSKGDLSTYVRISTSVCPLTTEDQTTFINNFNSHTGYTADVSGLICIYDGAFYLTPVDVNAFVYKSLPKKTDAEMVEFEKDSFSLSQTKFEEDAVIDLPIKGVSYEDVAISWVSDNEQVVVDNEAGTATITLGDSEAKATLTATYTAGDSTDTKEYELSLCAASFDQYVPKYVATPVAGTAYKFATYQVTLGKDLYFAGGMNGNFLATTDKASNAKDVYLEETDGGYFLYYLDGETKTYIEIYEYTSGKVGIHVTTETPTNKYTINEEFGVLVSNVLSTDYFLGTYKNYDTFSASKISYVTSENIGVSQFVSKLADLAPADYYVTSVKEPVAGTAYKFATYQVTLGKELYFAGGMNGNFLATTDKASNAKDVYLEETEGGYFLYYLDDETKTYIEIYEYTAGKVGIHLTTETPTNKFTINEEFGLLVSNVLSNDYYLGTYKTYDTFSASKISYVTSENIGVSQYTAFTSTLSLKETELVAAEVAKDTEYVMGYYQAVLGKYYYFAGGMNGNFLATTDKLSNAKKVTLEETEGGYFLYYLDGEAKTYIEVYEYTSGKVGVHTTTDTPTNVFTFDEATNTLISNVLGNDYYLGTYNSNVNFSASKTTYISGDNAAKVGITQFPAVFGNMQFVSDVPAKEYTTLTVGANCTVYEEGAENITLGDYTVAVNADGVVIFASRTSDGYGGPADGFYHDGTYTYAAGETNGIYSLDSQFAAWPATVGEVGAWTLYTVVVPEGGFIITGSQEDMNPIFDQIFAANSGSETNNAFCEGTLVDGVVNETFFKYTQEKIVKLTSPYTATLGSLSKDGGTIELADVTWKYDAAPYVGSQDKGAQIGSKNNPVVGTWTISTEGINFKITKIVVNGAIASGGDAALTISVGDTKGLEAQALAVDSADYEATFDNVTGAITISVTNSVKAFYIKTITVYFVTE